MGFRDVVLALVPAAMVAAVLPAGGGVGPGENLTQLALAASAGNTTVLTEPKAAAKTDVLSANALLTAYLGRTLDEAQQSDPTIRSRLTGLIATLPDPVTSRFAITFDDHFGALQRALEATGYVLDRFDLPWTTGTTPAVVPERPGVVLFRSSDRTRLHLLWVVGETPTSGIDKKALIRALEEYAEIIGLPQATGKAKPSRLPPGCGAGRAAVSTRVDGAVLPILGPTFSGSIASLELALAKWESCLRRPTGAKVPIRIISGSATAVAPVITPESAGQGQSCEATIRVPSQPSYQVAGHPFSATVASDEQALGLFLQHLQGIGVLTDAIALLTEANTDYGRAITPRCGGIGPLVVSFPLHIAQLRKNSRDKGADARAPGLAERERLSRLLIDVTPTNTETPPPQAEQSDASADVQLTSALENLAARHVRYVGILASDVRDSIFLVRALREHVPNATLFALNQELLYLHRDANPALVGTLILSSYPLASDSRRLTFPFEWSRSPSSFSTDRSVGVYNATLALLGKDDLMVEYAQPLERARSRPPHWLTVVGRGGLWPLQTLKGLQAGDLYVHVAPKVAESPGPASVPSADLPYDAYPMFIAWCVGCLFFLYTMGATLTRGFDGTTGRLRLLAGQRRFSRYLYILASLLVIASFQVLASMALLLPFRAALSSGLSLAFVPAPGQYAGLIAALVLMVVMLIVLPVAVGHAAAGMWRTRAQASNFPAATLAFLVIGPTTALIAAIGVAVQWWMAPAVEQVLLSSRTAGWTNGVSPIPPVVCLVLAALCSSSAALRRLNVLDETSVMVADQGPSFAPIEHGEAALRQAFGSEVSVVPGFWCVVVALTVPAVGLFHAGFAPPFEVTWFATFFSLGFMAVYISLITEAVRFAYLWWLLRGHLRRLAWHPTGARFGLLRRADDPLKAPPPPVLSLTMTSHPMVALRFLAARADAFLLAAQPTAALPPASLTTLESTLHLVDRRLTQASRHDAAFRLLHASATRVSAGSLLKGFCVHVAQLMSGRSSLANTDDITQSAVNLLNARSVVVIHLTLKQLQSLISFVTVGLLLMLLAVSIYPFQPHSWLLSFNWFIISSTIAMALVVFIQMDRDAVMSAMTSTVAGSVSFDRDFFLRLFLFVVVPLLSLLGANFPDAFRELLQRLGGVSGV